MILRRQSSEKSNVGKEEEVEEWNSLVFDPLVCVRCGYCKSTCPTYLAERDERFSPRGRLLLSHSLINDKNPFSLFRMYYDLDTCSKCAECEKTCPVGLKPYLNFVKVKNKTLPGKIESVFAKIIVRNKLAFKTAFEFGMLIRKAKLKKINEIMMELNHNTKSDLKERNSDNNKINRREIKGKRKIKEEYREKGSESRQGSREKYLFFPTCFGTTFFRETTEKAKELLSFLGVDFTSHDKFMCCGAPLILSGDEKSFKKHVEKTKQKLGLISNKPQKEGEESNNKLQVKTHSELSGILVQGATCAWVMKEFYKDIPEVHEITDFIINRINKMGSEFLSQNRFPKLKILVHIPCHEKYQSEDKTKFFERLGFKSERTEFPCCGFGGSMFFKHKKMSQKLLEELLKNKDDFDLIVSNSPGCIIQLSTSGKKVVSTVELIHFAFM